MQSGNSEVSWGEFGCVVKSGIFTSCVKIVRRFGAENAEIAPLARNGKHVGSDERAGTLALDDEWCRLCRCVGDRGPHVGTM